MAQKKKGGDLSAKKKNDYGPFEGKKNTVRPPEGLGTPLRVNHERGGPLDRKLKSHQDEKSKLKKGSVKGKKGGHGLEVQFVRETENHRIGMTRRKKLAEKKRERGSPKPRQKGPPLCCSGGNSVTGQH